MKDKETSILEMFQRVTELSDREAARLASNAYALSRLDELKGVVVEIHAHADKQVTGLSSARQATQDKSDAYETAFGILKAMKLTARNIPGQAEEFDFKGKPKNQDLIFLSRSYAAKATPIKAQFIERGLGIDFLNVLKTATDSLEQRLSNRAQQKQMHVSATATIEDLVEQGMVIVRALDTIMRNLFRDDPAMLAAWESASHVERAPRRAKTTPASDPTT
jgi:hypothetical protein